MLRFAWWLNLGIGLLTADSAAEDLAFCSCEVAPCEDEAESACVTFDEAADRAAQPNSGIYKVTTGQDGGGAVNASAANANAICQHGTCYVKGDGQVDLAAYGHQTVFFGWSGCSDSTAPHLTLGPLSANAACAAHFGPGLIRASGITAGRDDGATVQIAGSCSGSAHCSFLNGGSVTLTAPASDARFAFTGWSGCASSSEPTLRLTNVTQALPECVANYVAAPLY
ncbi:MAG TPA: hypothetical protein VFX59_26660 [Polyangiales bacterium]|nr:hypothetical protein [Polyangiales bacterium]